MGAHSEVGYFAGQSMHLFCRPFVALSLREGRNAQYFPFLTAKPKSRPWPSSPLCFQRFSEVTSSLSNFRLLADFDQWTKVETMTLSSPCFQPQNTAAIYSRPTIWRQRKQQDLFSIKLIKWLRHVYHNTLPTFIFRKKSINCSWLV